MDRVPVTRDVIARMVRDRMIGAWWQEQLAVGLGADIYSTHVLVGLWQDLLSCIKVVGWSSKFGRLINDFALYRKQL
eukprot:1981429-Ditylum_brightwellii.AAC.1